MKKGSNIRYIPIGLILALSMLLTNCNLDDLDSDHTNRNELKISVSLGLPGMAATGTRAMDIGQESDIDGTKLQVLVFEETSPGVEVFRYQGEVTEKNIPQFTLKVPVSDGDKKYRLVVLANADARGIVDGTPKETALQEFVFACAGKWNASSAAPGKIPMWGEYDQLIPFTTDRSIAIVLHRALARVDVGVLFKFNNPVPGTGGEYEHKDTDKESVYGLDYFKIKSVRVYRTRNKAFVASSAGKMTGNEVTTPNIPPDALYNSGSGSGLADLTDADSDPLFYELSAPEDRYIREIYLPESVLIDSSSDMDNVPCLVIGGCYGVGNTTSITYYRADFATYNGSEITAFRPILRNHQYVFDIKQVSGPGFEEPEQALHSVRSPMTLNVVEWNQVPLGFYVQGHYFLNVEEREIWLEARETSGWPAYAVPYQTNLDLDGTSGKSFEYTWGLTGTIHSYFSLDIDYANKRFLFSSPYYSSADLGEDLTDVITLTAGNLQFAIKVHQKEFKLDYWLQCDEVEVHGRYREGVPLNYSHYITLKVRTSEDFNGEAYEIKTLEKNGIYFSAIGTFNVSEGTPLGGGMYEYTFKLDGYGTPVNHGGNKVLESFEVTIVSNSTSEDYCSARISMGYQTKKILTIGANASYRYGYMLEPNTASRAFIDASVNFGTDPYSTVTMEENQYGNAFTVEVMTAGKGMNGEVIDYAYLKNKLNTFQPDIILTGQAVNYNAPGGDAIRLLSDFVDEGGVFLMCNEYYPVAGSINAMVQEIMGSGVSGNNQSIGNNQIFVLRPQDDLITNGPFGDMRGKSWGADGHEMHGFTNLPTGTIIYSYRDGTHANIFRHATKPFFFMGEGGFISNNQRYIGGSYLGTSVYFPFAIDANYRPISRTNYGISGNQEVFNSKIFGNILAWAVDYSDTNGIVYPDTGSKLFP